MSSLSKQTNSNSNKLNISRTLLTETYIKLRVMSTFNNKYNASKHLN